jgi:hypothetical protein
MSKARAKGTGWEVRLKDEFLSRIWPAVERAPLKGINDYGDFVNVDGLLLEAKKTERPNFLAWARRCTAATGAQAGWRVLWSGDQRKGEGPYVLLPFRDWLELEHYYKHNGSLPEEVEL